MPDCTRMKMPEKNDMRFLYELLRTPCLVKFFFEGGPHEAEAVEEDGAVVIRFDRKWYRTIDDFFAKAQIGDELLTTLYEELYGFEVIKDETGKNREHTI